MKSRVSRISALLCLMYNAIMHLIMNQEILCVV